MTEPSVVIADFDDLLVHTTFNFARYDAICLLKMVNSLGNAPVSPVEVLKMCNGEQFRRAQEAGSVGLQHWRDAWITTYFCLCERYGQARLENPTIFFTEQMKQLRDEAFHPLCDEADSTLRRLKKMESTLHLLTAGEQQHQDRKIDEVGIRHYFETVTVVPMHKLERIQEIRAETPEHINVFMVGDSLGSDIEPAREVEGVHPIHIPGGSRWPPAIKDIGNWGYSTIEHISMLPNHIANEDWKQAA